MSAKHTPGPWIVSCLDETERPGIDAHHLNFTVVCYGVRNQDDEGIHGRTIEEEMANARLIAAAPDLLEALLEAEAGLEFSGADKQPEGQFVPAPTLALRIVRAAIAKAKGEAQ